MYIEYIRRRAEKLRTAAASAIDPTVRDDYASGARHLEITADELKSGFHEDE